MGPVQLFLLFRQLLRRGFAGLGVQSKGFRLRQDFFDFLFLAGYVPCPGAQHRLQTFFLLLQSLQFLTGCLQTLVDKGAHLLHPGKGKPGSVLFPERRLLLLPQALQLLLQIPDGCGQSALLFLGFLQLQRDHRPLPCNFRKLSLNLSSLLLQLLIAASEGCRFFQSGVPVYPGSVLPEEQLLQFFILRVLQLPQPASLRAVFFYFPLQIRHFRLQLPDTLLQFLNLSPSAEKIAVIAEGTSRHGASGAQKLALQGHHADRLMIPPAYRNSMINLIHNNGSPQQSPDNTAVNRVTADQFVRFAQNTGFPQNRRISESLFFPHGRQGKEGGSPVVPLFQVINQIFGCILIVCDNILEAAAERGFDGRLVFLIGLDQIRNHAMNPRIVFLLLHDLFDAVSVPLVPLGDIAERFQSGGLSVKGCLSDFQLLILPVQPDFQLLQLFLCLFDLLSLPVSGVRDILQLSVQRRKLLPHLVRFSLHLQHTGGQLRFPDSDLLRHGVIALHFFPDRGAVVQKGNGIILPLRLVPGLFIDLLLDGRRRFFLLRFFRKSGLQLPVQAVPFCLLLLLLLQTPLPVFPDSFQTSPVDVAVHPGGMNLLLQYIDAPLRLLFFQGGLLCLLLHIRDFKVNRLQLVFHLVVFPAGFLECRVDFRKLVPGDDLVPGYFLQLFLRVFGISQKELDIQVPQLVSLFQILPCLLCLFFQRTQLVLQLRDNVIYPGQIRLLFLQLLQRGRLSSLKFNDSRRLIEKSPTFLRLAAQNLVNLTLADNGISLFSDTGVIEQFVDVTQTAVYPVQLIFTLAGAVQSPCYRHFVRVKFQRPVRIIQGNGHGGKPQRLPVLGTGKNNVLHVSAAKLPGALLAKHPSHGIRHITLSAAVRSHNACHTLVQLQPYFIGKGLKALNFHTF